MLGVQPSSPASNVGLVSFFDFLVSANGESLGHKNVDHLVNLIKSFNERELSFEVYNCKNHTVRTVKLVPSKKWTGGEGRLGVAIRYDRWTDAEFLLCRVLQVEVDSPADLAGLIPNSDYILGTQEVAFTDTEMLQRELVKYLGKTCKLYIYNSVRDEVRICYCNAVQRLGWTAVMMMPRYSALMSDADFCIVFLRVTAIRWVIVRKGLQRLWMKSRKRTLGAAFHHVCA